MTLEDYEAHAEAFFEQTGFMAPGKSVPLEACEQDTAARNKAWDLWIGRPRGDCPVCRAKQVGGED